ncbi:MAG: hypothetical protein AB4426_30055 [Xenococcaceae cyanobacterium]
MESIKFKTHVGDDGLLHLNLPVGITNQDLEVMVIYQPGAKKSHRESKKRFEKLRQQYGGKVFSDSVELLREDRQRG